MNTTWSKPTKYIAGVSLALVGIYILYLSRSVMPLLIVAALLAVIVRPVVLWLHLRVHLPLGLSVALVYLVVLILAPLLILLAIPTIIDALGYILGLDYQQILQDMTEWLRASLLSLKAAQLPVTALDIYVDRTVDTLLTELAQAASTPSIGPPSVETILQSLGSAVTTTFDVAAGLVGAVFSQGALVIFMFLASIYISLSAHTYRGSLLRIVPPAYQPEITILLARIERLWNAFFRGQLTLMIAIGLISGLGLAALGIPGALYLGIVAGLLEIIPSLGPIIATIPAVIVAVLQGSTYLPVSPLILAGLVLLLYVLVQQLENNIIVPRVLGEAVDLPPLIVIIGVVVGTTVAGILGALLATPMIATGREVAFYTYHKILGEEPFLLSASWSTPPPAPRKDLLQPLRVWLQRVLPPRLPDSRSPAPNTSPTSSQDLDTED